MNEEYFRSILIGSSDNVISCAELSRRRPSRGYTVKLSKLKKRSHGLVKHQQNRIVWQKSSENKCNSLHMIYILLYYIYILIFGVESVVIKNVADILKSIFFKGCPF